MRLLSLALRNLLRNRRRSLATVLAMVIGSVSILLFGGYVQNIVDGMQTDYVRDGGHLQLQHRPGVRRGATARFQQSLRRVPFARSMAAMARSVVIPGFAA